MSTITAYRVPPQQEKKAKAELQEARIRAYLPLARVSRRMAHGKSRIVHVPIAPGYVFASSKPHDAEHVREAIGTLPKGQLSTLYAHTRIRPVRPQNPYKAGDAVIIAKGAFAEVRAKVIETRARSCIIAFDLLGKTHQQAMSYVQLRPG